MASTRFLTPPIIKLFTAAAVIVIFGLVIYSMAGLPAPRESDRVTALDGSFSIIKPKGWDQHIMNGTSSTSWSGMIELRPDKTIGLGERIVIWQLRQPPELNKVEPQTQKLSEFQNQKLWVHVKKSRAEYVIHMLFQRPVNCWYDMEVHLPIEQDLEQCDLWPFVQTFQCQPYVVHSPTTAPATQMN